MRSLDKLIKPRVISKRLLYMLIKQLVQKRTGLHIAIIRSKVAKPLFKQLEHCIEATNHYNNSYFYVGKYILFLYRLIFNSLGNSFYRNVLDLLLLDDVRDILDIILDNLVVSHLPGHGDLYLSSNFLVLHV